MKNFSLKNIVFITAIICGGTGLAVFAAKKNPADNGYFLSIHGLPENSIPSISLNAEPLVITEDSGNLIIDYPAQAGSYKISMTLPFSDIDYADIDLIVDPSAPNISIKADGFEDYEGLFLTFGGQQRLSLTPFDWSGKLEINAVYPAGTDDLFCLHTPGADRAEIKICHKLAKRSVS